MASNPQSPNIYDPVLYPKEWCSAVIDLALSSHHDSLALAMSNGELSDGYSPNELALVTLASSILEGFHLLPEGASMLIIMRNMGKAAREAKQGRKHIEHGFAVESAPSTVAG